MIIAPFHQTPGTDETLLTACLLRYHTVMKSVMEAFIEEYGETLQDVVKAETRGKHSGHYVTLARSIYSSSFISLIFFHFLQVITRSS